VKLALREMRFLDAGRLEVEFLDLSTDKMILSEFHFRKEDGRIIVTGSEPDVLQWCEGSADDVRRVHRAVASFAEASLTS
jgi:hypothetical protein